ncbi:zona pellucida sperm-binding protein 3-like isoform X1 [Xiphophorus couchianus]|uniref:zona pellucida sperm-binding protein 3-like isoform X1 n=1 Tax=Xiphophorus couchianus TaxID=32473 RepID=UPI0010162CCC|nr:zona pellucida sperm-binding protein 3-like isoform X1 [Xiphophorus couchianus]
MDMFWLWCNLLLGVMFSGVCPHLALTLKSSQYAPYSSLPRPRPQQNLAMVQQEQHQPELVNTVRVVCHPDSLEVVIAADMFAVGAPVDNRELRLGVEDNEFCRAAATSAEEYRIVVGLDDCGTKHWMTKDSLVYTNLLVYSPLASPSGVVHMDEAVIPVECHYERKYGVSSSSLMPTWIPFVSTQAGVETLHFSLKLMNDDWMYERGANVFFLGEPINLEASVRIGHHMGLRVFLSSCVATLQPALNSDPKYIFIENGCLVDSQLPNSKAQFLPRTRDDKLQLTIDAFKFHNDDRGQLYITCHLTAVPVNDVEAPNKACTFLNGRWRSADGNDYLCGYCKAQNQVPGKSGIPGMVGPRGFGKVAAAESMWWSGLKTSKALWERETRVGPLTILPLSKSVSLPFEELPSVIQKLYRPTLYGSHWRSGIYKTDLGKGLLHERSTSELDAENETGLKGDFEEAGLHDEAANKFTLKSLDESMVNNTKSGYTSSTSTVKNATATETDLSDLSEPKK